MFCCLLKWGFINVNCKDYVVINFDVLNCFEDGVEVIFVVLVEVGIVKNEKVGIKVLVNGELNKKLIVKVVKFFKVV